MDASHAALSVRSGLSVDAPTAGTWTPRLTPDAAPTDNQLEDAASVLAENRIAARVAEQIGPAQFARYFSSGRSLRLTTGELEVNAPSAFVAGLLERRFRALLSDIASAETGQEGLPVRFIVPGTASAPLTHATPKPGPHSRPAPKLGMPSERFRLADFVPGQGNLFALEAVRRLIETDTEGTAAQGSRPASSGTRRRGVSILTVYGPCGVGKTHLLHAAAAALRDADPAATARVTTAEGFLGDFVTAIRSARAGAGAGAASRPARPEGFRREHRAADLLCIDDLAALEGKTATQTELLHTIDAITARGGRVFVTLPEHPRRMKGLSEALVSRLLGGMVAGLEAPDAGHRRALALGIGARHGLDLDEAAAAYIAELAAPAKGEPGSGARNIRPGVREIEGLIIKVEAVRRLLGDLGAAPVHGRVGINGVRRALEAAGLPPRGPGARPLTIAEGGVPPPVRIGAIVEAVCTRTGVTAAEIMGTGRRPDVVAARSIAGFVARSITTLSFPEIASGLGRPNHSTVITACRRVAAALADGQRVPLAGGRGDALLSDLVREIRSAVGA